MADNKNAPPDAKIIVLSTIIGTLDNTLTRYSCVKDPATRSMLFLDKFATLIDMGAAYIEANTDALPPELRRKQCS